MTSSYTANKYLEKPGNGDYIDTWNVPVNSDMDVIDKAFGGVLSKNATGASGSVNLTTSEASNLIIVVTGTLTANVTYTLPANSSATGIVGGQWIVYNNTTGSFNVTIAPVSGGGSSVTCTQGVRTIVYSDGTNVAIADDRVVPVQPIPSGTKMLFQQTSAPTGWVKDTTHNNKALRVVTGTASSGGSVDFTTAFASQSVTGTVGNTTLTTAQMPSHTHGVPRYASSGTGYGQDGQYVAGGYANLTNYTTTSDAAGGDQPHSHSFTGSSINLAVQYVDLIICTKS